MIDAAGETVVDVLCALQSVFWPQHPVWFRQRAESLARPALLCSGLTLISYKHFTTFIKALTVFA